MAVLAGGDGWSGIALDATDAGGDYPERSSNHGRPTERSVPSGPRTLIRDQGWSDPYRAVAGSRIAEHVMGRERSPDANLVQSAPVKVGMADHRRRSAGAPGPPFSRASRSQKHAAESAAGSGFPPRSGPVGHRSSEDLYVGEILEAAGREFVLYKELSGEHIYRLIVLPRENVRGPRFLEGHAVDRRDDVDSNGRHPDLKDDSRRGEVADGEARERHAESIEGPINALRVRELGPDPDVEILRGADVTMGSERVRADHEVVSARVIQLKLLRALEAGRSGQ